MYNANANGSTTYEARFKYRADGRLWQATVSRGVCCYTETYLYRQDGSPLELIRTLGSTARYWYVLDGRGNVVALTDANGAVVDRYSYDVWGKLLSATETVPQRLRYAGYWYDQELGWYWLSVRHYDPPTHRFLQPDPSEIEGLFSYTYAGDDPVDYTDPSGLNAILILNTIDPRTGKAAVDGDDGAAGSPAVVEDLSGGEGHIGTFTGALPDASASLDNGLMPASARAPGSNYGQCSGPMAGWKRWDVGARVDVHEHRRSSLIDLTYNPSFIYYTNDTLTEICHVNPYDDSNGSSTSAPWGWTNTRDSCTPTETSVPRQYANTVCHATFTVAATGLFALQSYFVSVTDTTIAQVDISFTFGFLPNKITVTAPNGMVSGPLVTIRSNSGGWAEEFMP